MRSSSARREYAALVSMCDFSLGRVLDFMDAHDMWDDTMLLVNTDHGFLLGEHGWWAKSVQPWFNELVRLPMFLWDPRTRGADRRRGELAQTIDIAPTVLRFFDVETTSDMLGKDLALAEGKAGALFGIHGGHVNVTDGRYVYMRASSDAANEPIEDFTLMPTHMRSRFAVSELAEWQPAAPFSFTKGLRTIRIDAVGYSGINSWHYGTLLWDLETDPHQTAPILDDAIELQMAELLVELLRENDAPPEHLRPARAACERAGRGRAPQGGHRCVTSGGGRRAAPAPRRTAGAVAAGNTGVRSPGRYCHAGRDRAAPAGDRDDGVDHRGAGRQHHRHGEGRDRKRYHADEPRHGSGGGVDAGRCLVSGSQSIRQRRIGTLLIEGTAEHRVFDTGAVEHVATAETPRSRSRTVRA